MCWYDRGETPSDKQLLQVRQADVTRIARRASDPHDVFPDAVADMDMGPNQVAHLGDVRGGDLAFELQPLEVHLQHVQLVLRGGIVDRQHHREAIELRLGQGVDTLVFDRVLRRQHPEWIVEAKGRVRERDLTLLHRFEQTALRFRGSAVDLVGEQNVGEDRTFLDSESRRGCVVDARADDVGGQHVGGQLDTLEARRNGVRQRRDGQGLGDAGNPFQKDVSAPGAGFAASGGIRDGRKQAGQQPTNQDRLPDDDTRGLSLDDLECLKSLFGCDRWGVGGLSQVHSRATNAAAAIPAAASR